jgi:hypothetical protein
MGLTGAGFVWSLLIVALLAVAACVRYLPRYSGPGRRQTAARAGVLAGGQAVVLLALLVVINSDLQFYSSWREVFGMDAGPVRVADRHAAPAPPAPSATPARNALTRRLPTGDGRLDALAVRGSRSGIASRVYVYAPPGYAHGRPLPVALFLASPRQTIRRDRLPRLAAEEIAAGRLRPMVLVIAPVGAGCVDAPGGRQGETFFSQDLRAAIAGTYHVLGAPGDWAVAGPPGPASYCAALLALRHSDRFGSALFSTTGLTPPPGDLYGGSRSIRDEYDPRWRIRHRPPPPVSVGVTGDDGFAAAARPPMEAGRLPATLWRNLPAVLRWLGAHLPPRSRT